MKAIGKYIQINTLFPKKGNVKLGIKNRWEVA